ncbi:MAG: hypothetical protein IAE93_09380 [Ignavibacteria bacterium]|nr:hypothetical protein [Ignavibacteria bacterium]
MKNILKNFRSLVFTLVFASAMTGVFYDTAFTHEMKSILVEPGYNDICDSCYKIYIWINGVRWAQVYNQDGIMVNFYAEPEE